MVAPARARAVTYKPMAGLAGALAAPAQTAQAAAYGGPSLGQIDSKRALAMQLIGNATQGPTGGGWGALAKALTAGVGAYAYRKAEDQETAANQALVSALNKEGGPDIAAITAISPRAGMDWQMDRAADRARHQQAIEMQDRGFGHQTALQERGFGHQETMQERGFGQQTALQERGFGHDETMQQRGFGQQTALSDRQAGQARDLATHKAMLDAAAAAMEPGDPNELRDDYTKAAGTYETVRDSYARIKEAAKADPSPAGDLALIYNYVRMLDPGSVVRETEFAVAAQAGSYGERVKAMVGQVVTGQRLTASQRADFISQADNIYRAQENTFKDVTERYRGIAERSRVNPDDVLTVPGYDQAAVGSPTVEPTATNPQTGEKLVLRNGQWVPQ